MDPMMFTPQTNPIFQPMGGVMFATGVFYSVDEADHYLSSLDSDTREYVLNHTTEFRSRQDIEDCVYKLRHGN